MKTLKNILSVALVVMLAGCATVTDANVDHQEVNNEQTYTTTTTETTTSDDNWFSRLGNDMDPIIDERDNQRN